MPLQSSLMPVPNKIPVSLPGPVTCMRLSSDGNLLAVASGPNIDIWDVSSDSPRLIVSDSSSPCEYFSLAWLPNDNVVIAGHASGHVSFMSFDQDQLVRRRSFSFGREKIRWLSFLDDRLLALATNFNVLLVEITADGPVLLGHLPTPLSSVGIADTKVTWVSDHEIAVCYSNLVVRWLVQSLRPLKARIINSREIDGLLIDISDDNHALVAQPFADQFTVISLKCSSPEIVIPRASGLPRVALTSSAIFLRDTVLEAGIGCLHQWDLKGCKLRTLTCPDIASAWFNAITHLYNPVTNCIQVASITENIYGTEIALWKTAQNPENVSDSSVSLRSSPKHRWIADVLVVPTQTKFPLFHHLSKMSSTLVWKPFSVIHTYPDSYSKGVTAMAFSGDGRFLAVATGRNIEIWDTRSDSTDALQQNRATHNICSLSWFRNEYSLISGHDAGRIYHTKLTNEGPESSGTRQKGHHSAITALSFLNDRYLAAATDGRVQIWEFKQAMDNHTWDLLGYLPPPPSIGKTAPVKADVSQSLFWLDNQELLVSYENVALICYKVRSFHPLETDLKGANAMAGIVTDVCLTTRNILVTDSSTSTFKMYSYNYTDVIAFQLCTTFIPQSRVLNKRLRVSKASFCTTDSVIGASCAYDYRSQCGRMAIAIDQDQVSEVTLWTTVEEPETPDKRRAEHPHNNKLHADDVIPDSASCPIAAQEGEVDETLAWTSNETHQLNENTFDWVTIFQWGAFVVAVIGYLKLYT
ncbi:WD40 repeat-like protein [Dendrothele bispora CBS 962.96]|uniref:WD40 repeat-like protein n=1 Tax=Dendrothele bispora (strain CBS 962.96) TaxID=1314807 RepID=A0A4S8L858_DENBC|nr:WD40 repeat-like protein [Dendrothele bispora CBS 962.96]